MMNYKKGISLAVFCAMVSFVFLLTPLVIKATTVDNSGLITQIQAQIKILQIQYIQAQILDLQSQLVKISSGSTQPVEQSAPEEPAPSPMPVVVPTPTPVVTPVPAAAPAAAPALANPTLTITKVVLAGSMINNSATFSYNIVSRQGNNRAGTSSITVQSGSNNTVTGNQSNGDYQSPPSAPITLQAGGVYSIAEIAPNVVVNGTTYKWVLSPTLVCAGAVGNPTPIVTGTGISATIIGVIITMPQQGNVNCTFRNSDAASLFVRKYLQPDINGNTVDTFNFTLTGPGSAAKTFSITTSYLTGAGYGYGVYSISSLPTGTYSISEQLPSGNKWVLQSATCTPPVGNPVSNTGPVVRGVVMLAGQTICDFNNGPSVGSIRINKSVQGPVQPTGDIFTFNASNGNGGSGSCSINVSNRESSCTINNLPTSVKNPGGTYNADTLYSVRETGLPGPDANGAVWTQTVTSPAPRTGTTPEIWLMPNCGRTAGARVTDPWIYTSTTGLSLDTNQTRICNFTNTKPTPQAPPQTPVQTGSEGSGETNAQYCINSNGSIEASVFGLTKGYSSVVVGDMSDCEQYCTNPNGDCLSDLNGLFNGNTGGGSLPSQSVNPVSLQNLSKQLASLADAVAKLIAQGK
jgi:hypothetical protein